MADEAGIGNATANDIVVAECWVKAVAHTTCLYYDIAQGNTRW